MRREYGFSARNDVTFAGIECPSSNCDREADGGRRRIVSKLGRNGYHSSPLRERRFANFNDSPRVWRLLRWVVIGYDKTPGCLNISAGFGGFVRAC
jgi:hypothetical protein